MTEFQWVCMAVGLVLLSPTLAKLKEVLTGYSKPSEFFENKLTNTVGLVGLFILFIALCLE
ncbi:hypothetical protein FACS1894130_00230 [Spirochaetia bacterium]|nr:hypothetical protein FACS1894130_00230 [Spirochaetia bacterium]